MVYYESKGSGRVISRKGRPSIGKKPLKAELQSLYEKEGRSIREIADVLKCSKDMIFRCLKEYQINPRTNARRSSLRNYDLEFLEAGIKEKGLREFARELRIDKSALLRHIRARKIIK